MFIALMFPHNIVNAEKSSKQVYWGFYAHRLINRQAIYTLPDKLFAFYKPHLNFIEENSVNADKRRHSVKGEAECHFIDLDEYTSGGDTLNYLPISWNEAISCYAEENLRKHGIGPWHSYLVFQRLKLAFETHDLNRILKNTSDLGHYIADMHVPLHTTKNYNGQLTGQDGIHALWESSIPEQSAKKYSLYSRSAKFLQNPAKAIWEVVYQSNVLVSEVLQTEDSLSKVFGQDKFQINLRNGSPAKSYKVNFVRDYEQSMNGMVESRIKAAIELLGDLIFSAWVLAGEPNLSDVSSSYVIEKQGNNDSVDGNAINLRIHE